MAESFQNGMAGPLLREVLRAQRSEERAVDYPEIVSVASALVDRAGHLGNVTVWPVGAAAERIAGAAVVLARGGLHVATWNTRLVGQRVLLFTVVGVTPMALSDAARHVRQLGATEVHACGVAVAGGPEDGPWETYSGLVGARLVQQPPVAAASV